MGKIEPQWAIYEITIFEHSPNFEIINNMKENTASENATTWYNWNINED